MTEHQAQVEIFNKVNLLCSKYPELTLLSSSLNGVKLTLGQAKKMKASGMKKGYPDLFLPVPRGKYHGLFIELKVGTNKPTKEQRIWLKTLNNQGYKAVCCVGVAATMGTILNYIENNQK